MHNLDQPVPAFKEWNDPYNSFNSLKGLLYRQWMEGIVKGELLPPVEASLDPIYACNLSCCWCNSKPLLKNPAKQLSDSHFFALCRFLAKWGVKAVCFAGGGEPLLHPACDEATQLLNSLGLETAFLTNGLLLKGKIAKTLVKHSRWVGFSVDSADRGNFARIKNTDPEAFDQTIANLKALVKIRNKENSSLEISYKFLIHPENAHLIYPAAKLAVEIGVDYFHIRPAASENVLGDENCRLEFPLELINKQLEMTFSLENEKFKIYSIRHKFSPRLSKMRNFSRCLAAPLLIQLGADGNCYLCVDQRGKPEFIIGKHYPNPQAILEFWGKPTLLEFMSKINPDKCPRCTFGIYNEIMENAIQKDKMCKNFP